MRYQHIIEAVFHQPWLITAQAHSAIRSLVESHLAQSVLDVRAAREGEGPCGQHVELEQMQIIDGIAHIPIGGVIGQRLSKFEKGSGAVDVGDISGELAQAESDPHVNSILLDFDSPGGMVSGTPELADRIAGAKKPVYSFTSGQIASAAYWLASASDAIFATQSADVGSIGVYMPWIDATAYFANKGFRVDLIKAGKLKGTGFPGTALSPDQRAYIQERVDQIYGMFTAHVRAQRGEIADDAMQGQTFLASEAADLGLIDGLVQSKADVIAMLAS